MFRKHSERISEMFMPNLKERTGPFKKKQKLKKKDNHTVQEGKKKQRNKFNVKTQQLRFTFSFLCLYPSCLVAVLVVVVVASVVAPYFQFPI